MALPATCDFTGTDGHLIPIDDPSWYAMDGYFAYSGNAAYPRYTGYQSISWQDDAFADDQYSEGTVVQIDAGYIGVAARAFRNVTLPNYYGFYGSSSDCYLFKVVDDVYTELDSDAFIGFSPSDRVRIEASGTTIRGLIEGFEILSAIDGSLSSGAAGLAGIGYNPTARIDDWEGGDLGVSASASASASPSASASASASASPSASLSPSASASASPSASLSPSASASASGSASLSPSASVSASASASMPATWPRSFAVVIG